MSEEPWAPSPGHPALGTKSRSHQSSAFASKEMASFRLQEMELGP